MDGDRHVDGRETGESERWERRGREDRKAGSGVGTVKTAATVGGATVNERARTRTLLAGTFLLSAGANGFIIAPSAVSPLFVERFGVPTAAVGNAVSVTFVGLVLTQIPGGYLLDRFDNRAVVAPAAVAYVLIAVGSQWVDGFASLLALRVVGGVVVGLVFTGGANVVGEVVPADRQGVATGIYLTSPPASFAVAHVTGPVVGTAFGPLRVFLVHAAVAVVGLVLFLAAAREPIRGGSPPTVAEFVQALGDRSVLLVAVSACSSYALYLFLNSWLPTYGREVLSLSLGEAGVVTALVPLVGIVARSGGGWLSGYLGGRRRPVLAGALVLGAAALVLVPLTDAVFAFVVLAATAGFAVQLGSGVYYVLARELASVGTEGTSLTVLTTVVFVGSFSGPFLGGWLIASTSWTVTIIAFAGIGLAGTLALIPVPEPGAAVADDPGR